jgi:hypothetical protein
MWIGEQRIDASPVCFEELITSLAWKVQAQAAQPGRMLALIEILQALELRLATAIEFLVVGALDVLEQQQIRIRPVLVGSVGLAVLDADLRVIGVAPGLLRKSRAPQPFGACGATEMIVEVTALG